jgi:hypothetical protein
MQEKDDGRKFFINIEGVEYPWDRETITVSEIRTLGKLPANLPVIEEDPDGREITLQEGQTVTIKPGHRHGRASRYKRG